MQKVATDIGKPCNRIVTNYCYNIVQNYLGYITGIDIKNLANLIGTDEILERKDSKINWKQLYDGILCENV